MMNMKHWIWFLTLIPKMNKSEAYQKFADYAATQVVSTSLSWMEFLDIMARNSKRSIQELLLIYLQQPEVTDCHTRQEWMQFGCRVRRSAIGVRVPDRDAPEKMQYLFSRDDVIIPSTAKKQWEFPEKYEAEVVQVLEKAFGSAGIKDFRRLVEYAVITALDVYWDNHDKEVVSNIMEGIKGWGEYNAKLKFMDAVYFSANYMILQRCGKHPRYSVYEPYFFCVKDFSSPNAMATLGEAVRAIGNQVLEVIEKTITERTAQRNNSILAEGE